MTAWPGESLTETQRRIVTLPVEGQSTYVHGLPGTGKSTALVGHVAHLVGEGCRPDTILVLLNQRAQIVRYEESIVSALRTEGSPACGGVDLVTFYGLCRRMAALFWPLVADVAGFARPDREPTFLTIETTQYHMWRIVEPLVLQKGYLGDVSVRRGRLLSQLIDNLNKSALVGFDHSEIGDRLGEAWTGDPQRLLSYQQAQECAAAFRRYCLAHNLIDFSLQVEVFARHLMASPLVIDYLRARYEHLIVDNLEEQVPVAHDFCREMLGMCRSVLLAQDDVGGYRVFLGADERGARALGHSCDQQLVLSEPVVPNRRFVSFAASVADAFGYRSDVDISDASVRLAVLDHHGEQYWIGMLRWIARRAGELVDEGVPPGEIAIVAPYVSEVMRFSLEEELSRLSLPVVTLRPSEPLRESPIVRGMLTLARLAHPEWEIRLYGLEYGLSVEDVALAFERSFAGMDPIRALALADAAYSPDERGLRDLIDVPADSPRASRVAQTWERVGYKYQDAYDALRAWLETYKADAPQPLDQFFTTLFGTLLSRPGYAYYRRPQDARAFGRLVESCAKFRQAVQEAVAGISGDIPLKDLGREYTALVLGDVAAAEYVADRAEPDPNAILLAPAYSFLTRDVRSAYLVWADLSSEGWWHRPNQPLTHPYVLSRQWPRGRLWQDTDEQAAERESLARVLIGLAARCTQGIILASSQYGIGGEEQRGRLERAVLTAMMRTTIHD